MYDPDALLYPDSDGKPMSDNTVQYRWIVTIKGNLELMYEDDDFVFVAADLLWYADRDDPKARQAPDTMIVFGRPKGDRGSYRQWLEENTPPQVVFEILSPGNRLGEMTQKRAFYDRHGVEEYYVLDPKDGDLEVWLRNTDESGASGLEAVNWQTDFVSPRTGIRFVPQPGTTPTIFHPDGKPFLSMEQIGRERDRAQADRDRAQADRDRAQGERDRAEARADDAEAARDRAFARLRALGIDPASL